MSLSRHNDRTKNAHFLWLALAEAQQQSSYSSPSPYIYVGLLTKNVFEHMQVTLETILLYV